MGVIDEAMWDDGVQNCLDRSDRRAGINRGAAQFVRHLEVGQRVERRQTLQICEAGGSEAARFNRRQIPTAALDVEDVLAFAE